MVGQAFLRQKGGGIVTCAGSSVFLLPDTPYFVQAAIASNSRNGVADMPKPPSRDVTGVREGTCDAQGNFKFTRLPAGKWQVTTRVSWVVGYARQGGTLLRRLETSAQGEVSTFLLDEHLFSR